MKRTIVYDWLRTLVNVYLSRKSQTPRQVAIEAMLIDLLDYTDDKIDDEALDRSIAALKEYKKRVLS